MKKIVFLFLIILFLFPILGEATCCEKLDESNVAACSSDQASDTECSNWAGGASRWHPTVDNCDYVTACTDLSGETVVAPTSTYQLEVPLGSTTSVTGFNEYIKIVYRFAVGLIALIALFLIVLGGIIWIIAAGNEQSITKAKTMIMSAIIGLLLALSSYIILYTINPKLIELESMQIPLIQLQEIVEGTIIPCDIRDDAISVYNHPIMTTNTPNGEEISLNSIFVSAGRQYDIDPLFVKAIAHVESSFKTDAESICGAYGIMQIQPDTAISEGLAGLNGVPEECSDHNVGVCASPDDCGDCDTYNEVCKEWIAENPDIWIALGAKYLGKINKMSFINGDLALTAAAYNAGAGRVQASGGIPNIEQTIDYVQKVREYYERGCTYLQNSTDTDPADIYF